MTVCIHKCIVLTPPNNYGVVECAVRMRKYFSGHRNSQKLNVGQFIIFLFLRITQWVVFVGSVDHDVEALWSAVHMPG